MNKEEKQQLMRLKESVSDELERTRRKIQGVLLNNGEEDIEKLLEEVDYAESRIEQIKQTIQEARENK